MGEVKRTQPNRHRRRKLTSEKITPNVNDRKIYLDILKIFSILSVMYVHTGLDGMNYYEQSQGIGHFISFFLRECVHTCSYMFFVISGALLLKKEEPLKVVINKRVLRYVTLIFIAGSARLVYYNLISHTELTIEAWFRGIYSTNVLEQYWFLHAYLAFLILLPFLRMIARGLKKDTAIYLMALMIIFNFVLTYFEKAWDFEPVSLSLPLLTDIIILPLMGYCIEEIFVSELQKTQVRRIVYLIALFALLLDVVYTYRMYRAGNVIPEMNGSYMLMTAGLYVLGRQLFKDAKFNEIVTKVIGIMGASTLTIIVFEPELRELTHPIYRLLAPHITWLLAVIIWLVLALILGSLLSLGLKKVPGVKKLF